MEQQKNIGPKIFINRKRTLTRLIAVQILYQYNFFEAKRPLQDIKKDVLEHYVLTEHDDPKSYQDKIDHEFLINLIDGIIISKGLDQEIEELLKKGSMLEDLDEIMRQILLFAAFELKFMLNTPERVVVSEYVDIAASFLDEKKVAFVNGVLQNLAKKLRNL